VQGIDRVGDPSELQSRPPLLGAGAVQVRVSACSHQLLMPG
jgi:hypothetical protein